MKKKNKMKEIKLHDAEYWVNRPLAPDDKDWIDDQPNWVQSYVHSTYHPHRQLVVDAVREFSSVKKVLEVGCNTGSNLLRIQESFLGIKVAGIDVSEKCISLARYYLEKGIFKVANYLSIPFATKSFDVVIADATLMYVGPKNIGKAMKEIDRVSRQGVVIVDRFNKSKAGVRNGHVWARNYQALLEDLGYEVRKSKITKEQWPNSVGWQKYGYVFVARK